MKLVADWIIKNHYLDGFPFTTVCYGIFRSGELAGVAVLGTAQRKNTIPKVFGPAHARDCLLLQRFALEDALEFNVESYFLTRIRAGLKREGYCGVLTIRGARAPKTDAFGNIFGCTNNSDEYLFADGIVLSNRSFGKLVNDESVSNLEILKLLFNLFSNISGKVFASQKPLVLGLKITRVLPFVVWN